MEYVSLTYDKLHEDGYPEDSSWSLVSRLVHRIFSEEFYNKRAFVQESMEGSLTGCRDTRKALGARVLWVTIQTHGVMEEFMR